jgi:hypothetical protein
MHAPRLIQAALAAAVLVMATTAGCGGGGEETSSTGRDTTSSSTAGGGGNGGTGGAGGGGGAGGQGGSGTADNGVQATETVSAGEVSKSPNYKMVFTFGQPTQNQGKTTSPSYRMQGGLVGANGSAQ